MHETVIDPALRARFMAMKGGREFSFSTIDPSRCAHLVIDMQNGFLEPGAMLEVPVARAIVPNVNALGRAVRDSGGVNVFFRFTTSTTSGWPVYFEQFQSTDFGKAEVADFQPGSHGQALYPELEIAPADVVLDKTRFSAFTPGASAALELLRARGIDTVFVSGTLSDCCCESTARDAQQLGFRVIFLSDANAALSDADHNRAVASLACYFADIRSTEEVIGLIRAAAAGPSDARSTAEPVAV